MSWYYDWRDEQDELPDYTPEQLKAAREYMKYLEEKYPKDKRNSRQRRRDYSNNLK